jgi:hypothetical protein
MNELFAYVLDIIRTQAREEEEEMMMLTYVIWSMTDEVVGSLSGPPYPPKLQRGNC